MKILVTGAKGQLGSQIINIIKDGKSELGNISSEVATSQIVDIDFNELDITDLNATRKYVIGVSPDVVINCAAYTNVDACEVNEDIAFRVNALGPRNLAIVCEELGAKIIHISTDYVFNGIGSKALREYDITDPVSVYGKTKLAGEEFVKQFSSKYFIVRTAWLYGYNGNNFVYTMMKLGKEKQFVDVVNDQRGNPTNAEDLAHHLLKFLETEEYGIYHCTGAGECSWYDFAKKIMELAEINCEVRPCTSNQFVRPAKRPEFSSLDNMMLRCTIGDNMRGWEDALEVFIAKIKKKQDTF